MSSRDLLGTHTNRHNVPPIFEEALLFCIWCLQNTLGNQSNLCFKFKFFNVKKLSPQYLFFYMVSLLFTLQFFWAQSCSVIKMCICIRAKGESKGIYTCQYVPSSWSFFPLGYETNQETHHLYRSKRTQVGT
jgi:hypothetical protein